MSGYCLQFPKSSKLNLGYCLKFDVCRVGSLEYESLDSHIYRDPVGTY